MSIPHGEVDAAAASGYSKGQRRKDNKRMSRPVLQRNPAEPQDSVATEKLHEDGRSAWNCGRSVIIMEPAEHPVSLALDSIRGCLGDTLKSLGILPFSFLALRMHFLSAMVTFFGRGIPLPLLLHGKDAGGVSSNPAPQCHSGRAGLEYFLSCSCTVQPLVESISRLEPCCGGGDSAPADMERPWVRVKSAGK